MATDTQICETVREAIRSANERGDNWADAVDIALHRIGVEVDEQASREADTDGYGPVCVLSDGRRVWQDESTGAITVDDGS